MSTPSAVERLLASESAIAASHTQDRTEFELSKLEEPIFRELDWNEWSVRIRNYWHTSAPQRERGVTVTDHYFRTEQEALAAYPEAKVIV